MSLRITVSFLNSSLCLAASAANTSSWTKPSTVAMAVLARDAFAASIEEQHQDDDEAADHLSAGFGQDRCSAQVVYLAISAPPRWRRPSTRQCCSPGRRGVREHLAGSRCWAARSPVGRPSSARYQFSAEPCG